MNGKKVLIIDDDADLLHMAGLLFKKAGAQIFTACDGLEGISKLFTCNPDLIILDVMMPGTNGFEVCRRIRHVSDVPIIMLTALNHEHEMLRGLEAGADDFLSKPFNTEILLARAKTVLRRSAKENAQSTNLELNSGYLSIDFARRQVVIGEKRLKLTPIEFRLLVYLARNAGKVLTSNNIFPMSGVMNIGEALTTSTCTFRICEIRSRKVPGIHVISLRSMEWDISLKDRNSA